MKIYLNFWKDIPFCQAFLCDRQDEINFTVYCASMGD